MEDAKLAEIAGTLKDIRAQGTNWYRALTMGLFQGAGVVLGGIIALAVTGWLLSFLGVVPGFDRFEGYLNSAVNSYEHRP